MNVHGFYTVAHVYRYICESRVDVDLLYEQVRACVAGRTADTVMSKVRNKVLMAILADYKENQRDVLELKRLHQSRCFLYLLMYCMTICIRSCDINGHVNNGKNMESHHLHEALAQLLRRAKLT